MQFTLITGCVCRREISWSSQAAARALIACYHRDARKPNAPCAPLSRDDRKGMLSSVEDCHPERSRGISPCAPLSRDDRRGSLLVEMTTGEVLIRDDI